MSKYKLDKYDLILEKAGYGMKCADGNVAEPDVDTDSLTKLMEEVGIKMSSKNNYTLVIYNDDVNDMMYVALALYEVCGLNNEEALNVMMEAHTKGKSVAKSGSFEEMNDMKVALNKRNIEASVES